MEVVSYEISKKLKEKGFNTEFKYSLGYYDTLGNFMSAADHWFLDSWIIAATISQVLKWLREEKKIHIQVLFVCPPNRWEYVTIRTTNCEMRGMQASFISYELAALAGIEYVIDNLI